MSGKAAASSQRRCWGQPLHVMHVMHGELGDICPWQTKQVGADKA